LRGEFRRAGHQQRFGARAFQINDLRIHRRVVDLIGGGHDPLVEIAFQKRLESIDVILAEIVVLNKGSRTCVRERPGQKLGVDFSSVSKLTRHGRRQWKIRNIGELFDPETIAIAGTPFEIRYLAVAELPACRAG